MEDVVLNTVKSFEIVLITDKNNSYSLNFISSNFLEITANNINSINLKSFSGEYTYNMIQENKYFLKFNNINEIFDEIKQRVLNNKILIIENENSLILNIPLPSLEYKEIYLELKSISNNNEKVSDLTEFVINLNKEIIVLKNELTQIKNNENKLKDEVTLLKNKNIQYEIQEAQLKNEVSELKEKLNILWKEKEEKDKGEEISFDLDSKIINGNIEYNKNIKRWIDPSRKMKAELLYRLSEDGDKFSTFHETCDNQGPTLTLFHINDGNKVGIYTPLSWDKTSNVKKDMETFIFNLNKKKKYKKLKSADSVFCKSDCGPDTARLGCEENSMKKLCMWKGINEFYLNGLEILPNDDQYKVYDLIETEVYKIITE